MTFAVVHAFSHLNAHTMATLVIEGERTSGQDVRTSNGTRNFPRLWLFVCCHRVLVSWRVTALDDHHSRIYTTGDDECGCEKEESFECLRVADLCIVYCPYLLLLITPV